MSEASSIKHLLRKGRDVPSKNRNFTVEKGYLFFKLLDLTALVSGKIASVYLSIFF